MFDVKVGRVNDLVRKILQLSPEDHSVDFMLAPAQIARLGPAMPHCRAWLRRLIMGTAG